MRIQSLAKCLALSVFLRMNDYWIERSTATSESGLYGKRDLLISGRRDGRCEGMSVAKKGESFSVLWCGLGAG